MSGRFRNAVIIAAILFFAVSLGIFNFRTYRVLTGLHSGMKETAGNLSKIELELESMGRELDGTREYLGLDTGSGSTDPSGMSDSTGYPGSGNYYSALDTLISGYAISNPHSGVSGQKGIKEPEPDRITRLVQSPRFRKFLEERGCTVSEAPVETDDSVDYIISDSAGGKIGKISLNRKTGRIHIFDRDNVIVSPVKKN